MSAMTINQWFAQRGDLFSGVAAIIERYSKLAQVLPLRMVEDLKDRYGREVNLGGVGERILNQAAPDVQGSTVTPEEDRMTIGTRKILTDHRLPQGARAGERERGTRAVARWMEDVLFNGSSTAGSPMKGLAGRLSGDQVIPAGDNGGELTLELFEQGLDATEDQGGGIHAFMNKPTFRALKRLILAEAGGAALADVTSEIPKFENCELHVCGNKLDGSPVLDFDETQGSSDETCSIYFVAPGSGPVEVSGVKLVMASNSIELIEEGIRNSQYVDVLEVAFALGIYDPKAAARIKGITAAA